MRTVTTGLTFAAAVLLAGCATTPGGQRLAEQDPLEPLNRKVWAFNRTADKYALKPVAITYKTVTPTAARRGVHNVFQNSHEPWSFVNALLQGKIGRAFHTLGRFVINTTIGVGGLADHASSMGLKEKSEDLGQTLAVWGVNAGPYLMLPFLGPSTLRDSVGLGAEFAADPVSLAIREYTGLNTVQRLGITTFEIVNLRAQLLEMGADNFLNSSLDPYATARSAYLQRRNALILDQDQDATDGSEGVNPDDFEVEGDNASPSATVPPGVDPRDFEVTPDSESQPKAGPDDAQTPPLNAKTDKIDAPQ